MESKRGVGPEKSGTDVEQAETPSVEKRVVAELAKFLGGAVQPSGIGGQKSLLPCHPGGEEVSSFGEVSEKLAEAVANANSGAASSGDLPFSTLYRLCGKRLGEDLADRSKRPKLLAEILAAQVRDGASTCELLNSLLYGMTHDEIVRSISEGKGKLQAILALRHQSEKAVHSAVEVMNAVDEAAYPAVKIRQRRSVKVRMGKTGKQEVTLAGSTMQEQKKRQLQ